MPERIPHTKMHDVYVCVLTVYMCYEACAIGTCMKVWENSKQFLGWIWNSGGVGKRDYVYSDHDS